MENYPRNFDHDLHDSLDPVLSEQLNEVYRRVYGPLAEIIPITDIAMQKAGIDKMLVLESGQIINVDEKIRPPRKREYDDILVEIYHFEKGNNLKRWLGWLFKKGSRTDIIAYVKVGTGEVFLIPFKELRTWSLENLQTIKDFETRDSENEGGYITRNKAFPIYVVEVMEGYVRTTF